MSSTDMSNDEAALPSVDSPADDTEAAIPAVEVDDQDQGSEPTRERSDVIIPLSPGQILGGFAVLAGLIVMVRRRRRKQD